MPADGVVQNVLTDAIQGFLVPDDVFIVVALPERSPNGAAKDVDSPCGESLEGPDDLRQTVADLIGIGRVRFQT